MKSPVVTPLPPLLPSLIDEVPLRLGSVLYVSHAIKPEWVLKIVLFRFFFNWLAGMKGNKEQGDKREAIRMKH